MGWIKTEHLETFAYGFAEKMLQLFAKKTDIPKSLPADGGDATTVNGHTVNENVPKGAKFTDTNTTYNVMQGASASAAGVQGLVPEPQKGAQNSALYGDGQWRELLEATDEEIDAIIAGVFK